MQYYKYTIFVLNIRSIRCVTQTKRRFRVTLLVSAVDTKQKLSRAQSEITWVGLSTSTYSSLSIDDVIDITSFPVLPSRSRLSLVRRFWNQTFTCRIKLHFLKTCLG